MVMVELILAHDEEELDSDSRHSVDGVVCTFRGPKTAIRLSAGLSAIDGHVRLSLPHLRPPTVYSAVDDDTCLAFKVTHAKNHGTSEISRSVPGLNSSTSAILGLLDEILYKYFLVVEWVMLLPRRLAGRFAERISPETPYTPPLKFPEILLLRDLQLGVCDSNFWPILAGGQAKAEIEQCGV
ncbi:hypothetical protein ARMSODRAFT_1040778 [Armillaria solidipes]|uniref:Uncharacterized protein n=1 Tax=Armillaria solidipes TaxID=1076256 RepID=A0A2H3BBQ0_9AGAR|nr:hypothetical protein ARMSODRAFT_1040778 [Armillaria solidipes]